MLAMAMGIIDESKYDETWAHLSRIILQHDSPELFTGDITFTVKRGFPAFNDHITRIERELIDLHLPPPIKLPPDFEAARLSCLLKLVDMLEGLRWCYYQDRDPDKAVGGRWCDAIFDLFANLVAVDYLTQDELNTAWEIYVKYAVTWRNPSLELQFPKAS